MAERRMRILHLLAEGRVKAEEAAQMLEALEPDEDSGTSGPTGTTSSEGADQSRHRIIEMLWDGRIDAAQATALLSALNGPAARVHSLTLQGPSHASGRHLRLKWHDASGKRIEEVDVAAPLEDADALHDMLPEKALGLLDEQEVDLKRLAAQAQKLPAGTVVYHYDNDDAQGIEVRVEG